MLFLFLKNQLILDNEIHHRQLQALLNLIFSICPIHPNIHHHYFCDSFRIFHNIQNNIHLFSYLNLYYLFHFFKVCTCHTIHIKNHNFSKRIFLACIFIGPNFFKNNFMILPPTTIILILIIII